MLLRLRALGSASSLNNRPTIRRCLSLPVSAIGNLPLCRENGTTSRRLPRVSREFVRVFSSSQQKGRVKLDKAG